VVANVEAGSTFAMLQSAGAGGAGAAVVNGVVAGTVTGVVVAATVPRFKGCYREQQGGSPESGRKCEERVTKNLGLDLSRFDRVTARTSLSKQRGGPSRRDLL
jgi:shikimate 5-dehydrogenase